MQIEICIYIYIYTYIYMVCMYVDTPIFGFCITVFAQGVVATSSKRPSSSTLRRLSDPTDAGGNVDLTIDDQIVSLGSMYVLSGYFKLL